jgi:ATP-dependent helicase HrpA
VEQEVKDRSPLEFPPELPISSRVVDIATAINEHPVVIVAGATGSGKTTQLPKIALAMGRGVHKMIGVTQPRRIAATSVAARVASEIGSPLGTDVGYQVRFDEKLSPATYVKFMTDGILLAETQGDPLLSKYDTIVIDEAHERSLNIDLLLGWLKRLLPKRPDLKVIVSSATLELDRFSKYFADAPVIQVEGRTYPVEVLYEPPDQDLDIADAVANAVANIASLDPQGDILVFLPGEREIRESEAAIRDCNLRHTVVLPLYARLTAAEQARAFASIPERRVILATNVAETSLTIPGIVYVVDTGVARISRYEPRSGITQLQIEAISQASAEQRKGRCGRVRDGICIRLFDETSFTARAEYTDPEIRRTGLAGVILRMKTLGLDVEDFPFIDPPSSKAITDGYRVLEELGALDKHRALTEIGKKLARFPTDPRIARMILAGAELSSLPEVLVVAAALSLQDPRERPREHQQKADERHRAFRDDHSDFVGIVRLWKFIQATGSNAVLRRACKDNFLSYMRIREWREIHRQLSDSVRELGLKVGPDSPSSEAAVDALHQALLTGLLSRIGQWNAEYRVYVGARQTRFAIHPSSALAKKSPAWLMAFELHETTQVFASRVAKIEPEWLHTCAAHLLKRNYGPPSWSEKNARAQIKENATLYGLPVFRDRSVNYASVDRVRARLMFIDHALVRGEYVSKGKFQTRNQTLLDEVRALREKARKNASDDNEEALLAFFDAKVAEHVTDGASFEKWRITEEQRDPDLLALKAEDVFRNTERLSKEAFPDTLTLHGTKVPLSYKFDPNSDEDGITATVPLVLLPQLSVGELAWTIPGWLEEKIAAILYDLPRVAKRDLGDTDKLAHVVAARVKAFHGSLYANVVKQVRSECGAELTEEVLRAARISTHLQLRLRIVDHEGRVLSETRDTEELLKRYGGAARTMLQEAIPKVQNTRKGIVQWDFGALEPYVTKRVGQTDVRSYPALIDTGSAVDLELRESEALAEVETRKGVCRLCMLANRGALRSALADAPPPFARTAGALVSRAETAAFADSFVSRIVSDAFALEQVAIPRTKAAFDALLLHGSAKILGLARDLQLALKAVHVEYTKVLAALKNAEKHPSATLAARDIRSQLEALFPTEMLVHVPVERLGHYPRYLRGTIARLQRALADPQKDAGKLAPLAPVWTSFAAKRQGAIALREPLGF